MKNSPKQRTDKLNKLKAQCKEHPMCLDFEETSAHFVVIYPEGYWPNGARVEKLRNKTKALKLLIDAMERHWNDSCWWLERP